MSKQGNTPLQSDTSEHLKKILELTGTASLLSGHNLMVISEPGTGKSSLIYFMLKQVFGENFLPMYCTPTTREEEILGYQNPEFLLNRQESQSQGLPYWIVDETPFDPRFPAIFLNELSRLGDIGSDALIPAIDFGSIGIVTPRIRDALNALGGQWTPKVFWADSNWLTPTQRNAALRDRFGLVVHYSLPIVNIERVMSKGEISGWSFDLPDVETINEVRGWMVDWMEHPEGTKAFKLIVSALTEIQGVLDGKPFSINHRRVRQWEKVLFSMAAYRAGTPNFTELPVEAFEAMSYCYPTTDLSHSFQWQSIVLASVDQVASVITHLEGQALAQWKDTYESIRKERNPQSRQQRVTRELGSLLQGFQEELRTRFPNDPRVDDSIGRMNEIYRDMLTGRDPFTNSG